MSPARRTTGIKQKRHHHLDEGHEITLTANTPAEVTAVTRLVTRTATSPQDAAELLNALGLTRSHDIKDNA